MIPREWGELSRMDILGQPLSQQYHGIPVPGHVSRGCRNGQWGCSLHQLQGSQRRGPATGKHQRRGLQSSGCRSTSIWQDQGEKVQESIPGPRLRRGGGWPASVPAFLSTNHTKELFLLTFNLSSPTGPQAAFMCPIQFQFPHAWDCAWHVVDAQQIRNH